MCIIDVNECTSGRHNCSRDEVCVNREGSYQCVMLNEMCDEGFIHNQNRDCVGKRFQLAPLDRFSSLLGLRLSSACPDKHSLTLKEEIQKLIGMLLQLAHIHMVALWVVCLLRILTRTCEAPLNLCCLLPDITKT